MGEHACLRVRAAGREWTLLRPADLESLWEAMADEEFQEDERIPYWVEIWPSSLVLANWLGDRREEIAGRLCLDLGCGLGLTAMVAGSLGARVLALDYEKAALEFARLNARANRVPQPCWAVMDWRFPALRPKSFKFIWGGDIMYERRFIGPVLDLLDYALAPGGRAWLAEPGRNVYAEFASALCRRGRASVKAHSGRAAMPMEEGRGGLAAYVSAPAPSEINLWEIT